MRSEAHSTWHRARTLRASKPAAVKEAAENAEIHDLEESKTAVWNSLTSKSGQRTYDRATTDFVEWYCSEPRLALNRTVVLRYRIHLEQKLYAPATINLRLAAVRRVAYGAADSGLLSPELAAGIRRVKGVRRIGVRIGNWLPPSRENGFWRVWSLIRSVAKGITRSSPY